MKARTLPVLIALLLGCGEDSGTGPAALTQIEIVAPPALAAFMVNDSTHASVIGRDRSGNQHFAGPVTWRSSNATVFSVDSLGLIVGKAAGSAILIATVGELADSLAVTVAGTRHRWPIVVSETWSLAGSPHLVDGRLDVSRPSGGTAVLTIEAGVTVIFTDASGLTFGLNGPGLLRAMGTPGAP
ncbi:MAG TPA: Ig-like domain-containing protein, partial [Gemmatimonadales bacterium]|nr:Ig-like domain-containing protein [Gemmatimonadales bacterium]